MNNRLVPPSEYNQVMIDCINIVKYRMDYTCTPYQDDDIAVFDTDVFIYVLANPLLGSAPVFDENGNFVEMVPLYNISIQPGELSKLIVGEKATFKINYRLGVMRPDLCMRIDKQTMTVVSE